MWSLGFFYFLYVLPSCAPMRYSLRQTSSLFSFSLVIIVFYFFTLLMKNKWPKRNPTIPVLNKQVTRSFPSFAPSQFKAGWAEASWLFSFGIVPLELGCLILQVKDTTVLYNILKGNGLSIPFVSFWSFLPCLFPILTPTGVSPWLPTVLLNCLWIGDTWWVNTMVFPLSSARLLSFTDPRPCLTAGLLAPSRKPPVSPPALASQLWHDSGLAGKKTAFPGASSIAWIVD